MPRTYNAPAATWSAAIYGPAKTGKSYIAVSFPKPMVVVETDPLSFDRAFREYLLKFPHLEAVEMDIGEPVQKYDADIFIYRYPLTPNNHLTGVAQQRYEQIAQTILDWMSIPDYIKTVVLDTGDIFWENVYTMRLERADMASRRTPKGSPNQPNTSGVHGLQCCNDDILSGSKAESNPSGYDSWILPCQRD